MTSEESTRELMTRLAKSLFDRGFSVGSAGNISVAVADGFLVTPTNSCLGFLDPSTISKLDLGWRHVDGLPPSKEVFLHRAFYESRPGTAAVVHLHSTYATAISCMADIDPDDCIPPLTPYVVMRVGKVKLLPYVRPGESSIGQSIRDLKGEHAAILIANHGPVVASKDLVSAVYAAEELEETAKLAVILRSIPSNPLDARDIAELLHHYPRG